MTKRERSKIDRKREKEWPVIYAFGVRRRSIIECAKTAIETAQRLDGESADYFMGEMLEHVRRCGVHIQQEAEALRKHFFGE